MPGIDVTYRFPPGVDAHREANVLAIGQTAGTWGERWADRSGRLKGHLGTVLEIGTSDDGFSRAKVRFPLSNCPVGVGTLLTMIYGKYSLAGPARVVGLSVPEGWGTKGRFGIDGIRSAVGVPSRPLVMAIFKPSLGLSPEDHALILREAAFAGLDIIKDDEILPDIPECPVRERLKACRPVLEEVRRSTGRTVLYAMNLSGRADQVLETARALVSEGANALLVNALSYGFPVLESLATDPGVNVPLFMHPAFAGAWCGSRDWGLDYSVVLGTLSSLSGADAVLIPAHYGSLGFPENEEMRIQKELLARRVFPVPSAGIHPGIVPRVLSDYGHDVILNAGTGIMDHPDGTGAGVKAFFEALDRHRRGESFETDAVGEGPLKSALRKWSR
jgi:2,3-diketo-5-methylthiopentyl-1-phosphate enolase